MAFDFSSNSELAWKVFALEVSEIRTGRTGLLVTPGGRGPPEEAGHPRPSGVSGRCAFHQKSEDSPYWFPPFPLAAHVQTIVGTVSGLMFPFWTDPSPLSKLRELLWQELFMRI